MHNKIQHCLRYLLYSIFIIFLSNTIFSADTQNIPIKDDITYLVYFTGIGCPHCANVDSVLLNEKLHDDNIIIVEYEIYQQSINAPLIMSYNSTYNSGLGIPILITENKENQYLLGDKDILKNVDNYINTNKKNTLLLPNNKIDFITSDISIVPGLPKIWYKDRVAIKTNIKSRENDNIKKFLLFKTIPSNAKVLTESEVSISGDTIKYDHAIALNGWKLLYNN